MSFRDRKARALASGDPLGALKRVALRDDPPALALRGIAYRPLGAAAVLRRNLLIYGLGGLVIPFIGIKLIDIVITILGLV